MRSFFLLLAAALSTPLMILNWAAGAIGSVWLAIIGDWGALGYQTEFGMIVFFVPTALVGMLLGALMPGERQRSL
jgi:hypothetical protein